MVMMSLEEYDLLRNNQTNMQARIKQMEITLERYSHFMVALDTDVEWVKVYNEVLDKEKKIGSAFFGAFNIYKSEKELKL